jgi:steroid delta-isomerase-like uncharacterized protein
MRKNSAAANKAVIQNYLDTWNRGDVEGLAAFWSPELVHHTRHGAHGFADTRRIVTEIMRAFPDMKFAVEDMIAEGDRVSTRMTWRGTHTGMYMGAVATRKSIECSVIGVARVVDGKIVEHWGVTDELNMMHQMGLLPAELLQAMA